MQINVDYNIFFTIQQDYHDDIRQEQMWEMQALTSTPSTNNMTGDQNSPTNSVDMDITTDDKNPVSPSNNRNSNSCSPTTTTTQINSNDNENMILKQQQHQQQQLQLQQQIQQQQQQHDDMDLTTADNSASNKLTDTSQIISTSTASLIPTHITQSQSMLSANPSKRKCTWKQFMFLFLFQSVIFFNKIHHTFLLQKLETNVINFAV